jgi:hypothetical protein
MRQFLDERNLVRAALLALVALIALFPERWYEYHILHFHEIVQHHPNLSVSFRLGMDLVLLFILVMLCATAGFAWSPLPGLPGRPPAPPWRRTLLEVGPAGLLLALLLGWIADGHLFADAIRAVPANPLYPLRAAFALEIISRFGILSIAFRLSRSPAFALFAAALFTTLMAAFSTGRVGHPTPGDLAFPLMLLRFGLEIVLGLVALRHGLGAAMLFHALIGLKTTYRALF